MENLFDLIIIGGGIDGLVAAVMVARSGQKVLLAESRSVLGGAFTSEETIPGFRFDTYHHDLGWVNPAILQAIELNQVELKAFQADPGVVSLNGEHSLPLWRDVARTTEAIRLFSPADAEKWPLFVNLISQLGSFLESVYGQPAPEIFSNDLTEAFRLLGLGRKLRQLGKKSMMEMVRLLPMSVQELLDDWFETDALKGVLGAAGITNLQEGPRASGTAFVMLHHMLGQADGVLRAPRLPLGGIGRLAEALESAARLYHVNILTNSPVEQILVKDERAVGIVLNNGDVFQASRVLSTLDARQTFLKLISQLELDPSFVRALTNLKFRGIRAKMNLALDSLPRFTGVGEAYLRGLISVSPSLDYLEKAYDDAKYGGISQKPYLEALIPTLIDPSLAPPGKHILSIWMQYAPYSLINGDWGPATSQALGDLILDTLEEYAPGLKSAILFSQVLTPADLEANLGASQGNLYGGELTLDQILFMRPIPGWAGYHTPLTNLYMGGPAAHPGGGNAGATGYLAARRILKDLKS